MRIAAFVYDFPHPKSVNGLMHLASSGFKNVICLATPMKVLNVPRSKTRISPIIKPLHPADVADALNFEYVSIDHDSSDILQWVKDCQVGVILGARILKPFLVDALPIINMHPGILPWNRGLDNLKWAVLHGMPQGVTSHIIDHKIDRGTLIGRFVEWVYPDDTLVDIFLRLQNTELHMMIDALNRIEKGEVFSEKLAEGHYYSALPDDLDNLLPEALSIYKRYYKSTCEKFIEGEMSGFNIGFDVEPRRFDEKSLFAKPQ